MLKAVGSGKTLTGKRSLTAKEIIAGTWQLSAKSYCKAAPMSFEKESDVQATDHWAR